MVLHKAQNWTHSDHFTIGASTYKDQYTDVQSKLKGDIHEIVYYDQVLNWSQKTVIQNHLASKWNIEIGYADYYRGDTTGNGDFDFDVTGITSLGSDRADKVTSSREGALTISHNNKSDVASVFVGANGQQGVSTADIPNSADVNVRSQKVWYMDASYAPSKNGSTIDLAFDLQTLGLEVTGSDHYQLLSRTGAAEAFTEVELTAGSDISVNGNSVVFTGVETESLNDRQFTVGVRDTSGPELQSATVEGTKITLTFDEFLDTSGTLNANDFNVNGNTVATATVDSNDSNDSKTVTLTVDSAFASDENITIDYTGSSLKDVAGNELGNTHMVMVAASNAQGSSEGEDETFFVSNVSGGGLTLTGSGGKDTFDFNALSTGTVTIEDFNADGVDTLDLSDVLVGYNDHSKLGDFITVIDADTGHNNTTGDNVTLSIYKKGDSNTEDNPDLTITLTSLADIGHNNDWDLEQFYAHGFIVL